MTKGNTNRKQTLSTDIEIVDFTTNQTGERHHRSTGGRNTRAFSTRIGMQGQAHQAFLRERDYSNPDACDEPRLRELTLELQAKLVEMAQELGVNTRTEGHMTWARRVESPYDPIFFAGKQKLPTNRDALLIFFKQLQTMKLLAETELEEKKKCYEAEMKRQRQEAKLREKQRQEERERHRREMEEERLRMQEELRLQRQERELQAKQEQQERATRLEFLLKCLEDRVSVDFTLKDMELLREYFHDEELEPEAPQWSFHRPKKFCQVKNPRSDLPTKVGMRGRWGRIFRGRRSQNQNCSHYRHLGRTWHSARREYWVRNRPRSG